MSTSADGFKGPIILSALVQPAFIFIITRPHHLCSQIEAKPGKGDEIAKLLADIKVNANSDKEPGCSTYRVARYGDSFTVFEE